MAALAAVLSGALGAQAATLTMSADKATYNYGETITITVIGDSQGGEAIYVNGVVVYDPNLVSADGGQSQTALRTDGMPWIRGGLLVDIPAMNTQWSFSQINGEFVPRGSTKTITTIMTFTAAGNSGVAHFGWDTTTFGHQLDFFGLTSAPGISVTIAEVSGTAVPGLSPSPTLFALIVGLLIVGNGVRCSFGKTQRG